MSADLNRKLATARAALQQGDLAGAERHFRAIVKKWRNNAAALHGLGVVALNQQELVLAEEHLSAAAAISPGEPAIMADLATVYFYLERMNEAEKSYRNALAKIGKHPELALGLGLSVKYQGRFDEAQAIFRQAAADFPRHVAFSVNLAGLASDAGDHENAVVHYRRALQLGAKDPTIWASMAVPQMLMDQFEAADQSLNQALALDPSHTRALSIKIATAQKLGDTETLGRLLDYDNVIQESIVEAPAEYDGIADFSARILNTVQKHPTLLEAPSSKSTRNGAQTGNLLAEPVSPEIRILAGFVDKACRRYCSRDRQAAAPALVKPPKNGFYIMNWGTLLREQGHQAPHAHPGALLSAVYYAAVPEVATTSGDAQEGWIQFGLPGFDIDITPPLYRVKPVEGHLVVFPSYLWHETIPYSSNEVRCSIAHDISPRQ